MRRASYLILAAACCAATAHPAWAGHQTMYRVTILSSAGASANSINDLGVVGGSYTQPNGSVNAALWAFGRQVNLGTLGTDPTLSSLVQWPVKNVVGVVSGISLTDQLDPNKEGWSCRFFLPNPNHHVCLGFVWDPVSRQMRPLPTLGGTNAFATGTNDLGETVGWAETAVHDSSCIFPQVLQFEPVVWGPGREQIHALPLVADDTSGAATALNDRGQVIGISGSCGIAVGGPTAKHAVLWDNGRLVQIPALYGDEAPYWNTPMMINQRGDVVGFAGFPNDPGGALTPPFRWSKEEGTQAIPLLKGDIAGVATSINEHRQIVGYSNDASNNFHPWIWEKGRVADLNGLIEPGSGLTSPIGFALDINDSGEIVGATTGTPTIPAQAILLTPTDRDDD